MGGKVLDESQVKSNQISFIPRAQLTGFVNRVKQKIVKELKIVK